MRIGSQPPTQTLPRKGGGIAAASLAETPSTLAGEGCAGLARRRPRPSRSRVRGGFPALALAAMLLGACGFRPMHAAYRDGIVDQQLAQVYVASIPDRVGQMVRNDLIDLLNPEGQPADNRYRLEVELTATRPSTVLSTQELASRRNYTLTANYRLTSADGKTELMKRRHRAVTSFDIVESEFATLAAEDYAQKLAAKQVAEAIQRQVTLYFTSKR
jgi:LPS-assembly lipoprotein